MSISAIITAAGKNSRMRKDQQDKNLEIKNKLILPYQDSTVLDTTIKNILSLNISECIVVLGHYKDEIMEGLFNNYGNKVKFIVNDPVDVELSTSLFNGLKNSTSDYALCVTGDQPTISTATFKNINNSLFKMENPDKSIAILRRKKCGLLDTAEGLGMPFTVNKKSMMNYLENNACNINPILREMFNDGYQFYGVKEKNKLELLNINHVKDYEYLNSF